MNKEPDRNQRKALGKGLSALLPSRSPTNAAEPNGASAVESAPRKQSLPEHFEEFQSIPLDQIQPSDEQPRSSFDTEKLMELAQSIRLNGIIQPIIVHKLQTGKYQIIAGERRWKAAGFAGLKEIPALVRGADQNERLELALIENIQREDLNPIEIALAFQRLADEHGMSHEDIADRTGKDRSTVTNFLRLLYLSPFVRNEMVRGTISAGHGRALLNIADERMQMQVCNEIMGKQLSVRATEQLVKKLTNPEGRGSAGSQEPAAPVDPNIRAALEDMERALGTKVKLIMKSGSAGRLEIEYYSQDDLDRIYSVIVKQ